jgi:hypothetical protein
MAFSKAFERELNKLFNQRTDWLRRKLFTSGVGKPPKFSRKKVDNGIRRLQDIASKALAHNLTKLEFNQHIGPHKNFYIKGRGPKEKEARFKDWFSTNFGNSRGFVYVFWGNHGKCIYVGRTGSHEGRPSQHFEKYWFRSVKRVTIFSVNGKSQIPKLECLAIHRFQPTQNEKKAAKTKWTKACPLCKIHKYIEGELRDIFRLR